MSAGRQLVLIVLFALLGCTRIVYRDNPAGPEPVATPTPAPPSLRFPQGIPDAEILVVPGVPTLHDAVNAEIAAMFPACSIGQDRCDGLGYDPQSFYGVLTARLRARGLWAGQHRDGQTDEITVAPACSGPWENYKAWIYLGYPAWARPRETPCAGDACLHANNSYRGNTVFPQGYCK
jgi:hypothetical protein